MVGMEDSVYLEKYLQEEKRLREKRSKPKR
jgi:hypothetical protein